MKVIISDDLYFEELDKEEFQIWIQGREGQMLASREASMLIIVSVYPDLEDGAYLVIEDFDEVVSYPDFDFLTSDSQTYLAARKGKQYRYFAIANEPEQVYLGPYDRDKIIEELWELPPCEDGLMTPQEVLERILELAPVLKNIPEDSDVKVGICISM